MARKPNNQENDSKVKPLKAIGDKPISFWVNVINAKAKKERKYREAVGGKPVQKSILEKPRQVRVLLEHSHLPITQTALEEIAGVGQGALSRWLGQYKKEEATPSTALFCNVFLRGRNQIKLYAANNIYKAIENGDTYLSEKVMVATNEEYNPKQVIEKTETKNINFTYQNLSDDQLDERIKRLADKTKTIELKETKDKDGNTIYSSND